MITILITAIIIFGLEFLIDYLLRRHYSKTINQSFSDTIKQIETNLTKEKELKQSEIENEIKQRLAALEQEKVKYEEDLKYFTNYYIAAKQKLEDEFNETTKKLQEKGLEQISENEKALAIELQQQELTYKANLIYLKNEHNSMVLELEKKRQYLEREIESLAYKQYTIVERLIKDEQIKQQQDFYHIKLDTSAASDISKLKLVAEQLSKPVVLYKLIYENYYRVKLEELFKRVLGDKAKCGGIYKITNIKNQKLYIGRTTEFLTRWRTHAKRGVRAEEGTSNKLYQFMWEEGIENFNFEIVEVCDKTIQSEREKYWIGFYHSDEYGYNSNKGG